MRRKRTKTTCRPPKYDILEAVDGVPERKLSKDATINDVLSFLFRDDLDEPDFMRSVTRGAAEEIEALGQLLLMFHEMADIAAPILLRLAARLRLCLAAEQRKLDEVEDDGSTRQSGEFVRAKVAS